MKKNVVDLMIRPFEEKDQIAVIALWQKCNLLRAWNDPVKDIMRKLQFNRELFLIGLFKGKVIATVMGGYEGHRGWINYLAVEPCFQKKGVAKRLMVEIEHKLVLMGCPKINLQVRLENKQAQAFYEKIGYSNDGVISFGKRLIKDN